MIVSMHQIEIELDLTALRSGAHCLVTPHSPRGQAWITDNFALPEGLSHDKGLTLDKQSLIFVVEAARAEGLVVRLA